MIDEYLPIHLRKEYNYQEDNPFVDTYRFAPVANGLDLPAPGDPFYISVSEWDEKRVLDECTVDEAWWYKQRERCLYGYTIKNARKDGSSVTITGRHYFYLNFWYIYGKDNNADKRFSKAKTLIRPRFIDLDYFFFWRVESMIENGKDDEELKARQKGFSEKIAGGILAYNYTFVPFSQSIVVAGNDKDSKHTMSNAIRGLDQLVNTQFYKIRKRDAMDYLLASNFGSEINQLTAGSQGEQSVSRFSPYFIIYEECYGKDTKVLMYDGEFKKIQDIKTGDIVMGNKSKPMVVGSTTKGIDDLYKIHQRKGDDYIVNSKHRLCLEQKTNIEGYKNDDGIKYHTVSELEALNKTKRRCTYGVKSRGVEFKEKPLVIDPYFLGLWLGDGDKNRLRITTCDKEIEDAVRDFCNLTMSKLRVNYYKNSNNRKLDITSIDERFDYWKALLKQMNLYCNKHIPKSYLKNSRSNRLKLLAGLIDTDGSLLKSASYSFHYEITQKSKLLSDDIIYLCRSLGFRISIKEKIVKGSVYYRMTIYGNIWEIPVRLKRKMVPKDWKPTSDPLNTQISVEHIGKGEYFGFTLIADNDEDRQIIINDFTMSMNCGKWPKGLITATREFVDASLWNEGEKTGYAIYIGTGGDMDGGAADLEMMYNNPANNNLLEFPDVNEPDHMRSDTPVASFTPAWMYNKVDRDGNSLKKESTRFHEDELAKRSEAKKFLYRIQHPMYASDAFMIPTGGYFGKEIVQRCVDRRALIIKHSELSRKGMLGNTYWRDPKDWSKGVYFKEGVNENGKSMVLYFEDPKIDPTTGIPYNNLYKQTTDSYDRDEANTSSSRGSTLIFHGFFDAECDSNYEVARLTIRPETFDGGAEKFYEETLKLNILFNSINLIEFSNIRIFDFYKNRGFNYMLKERPQLMISRWIEHSQANNQYGIDPSSKPYWLSAAKDWLMRGDYNFINNCNDEGLLHALAKFRYDPRLGRYNCDITITFALMVVLLGDEEGLEVVKNQEVQNKMPRFVYKRVGNKFEIL